MRAIRIDEFGGPEVLSLVEAPVPEPNEGQVLIEVERAGINMADIGARLNAYLAPQELPLFPGLEVAGRVAKSSNGFQEGQRVMALVQNGGYAEYVATFAPTVLPIPDELETETALPLLLQGLTAWHVIHSCGRLREGESIAIGAAAGGVGTLAVQLAKLAGAEPVIAMASSDEKRQLCRELGADAVVDSRSEDLTASLLEANGGAEIDLILEMTGGPVFTKCLAALAPFGRLVVYGAASSEVNEVPTFELMQGTKTVSGFWLVHVVGPPETYREPMDKMLAHVIADELKVKVGGVYPLEEAQRAHEDLQSRKTSGKLMLDPTG